MTTYQNLDWHSLNFVRTHLYRRIANPLNNALGRLMIAQHIVADESAKGQFVRVAHGLEVTLNLVKAWVALIHVQSGSTISDDQRRAIRASDLPEWLVAHLNARAAFQATFVRPIKVHPETFFEMLVLLCSVAGEVGELKSLVLRDTSKAGPGVWVRAVFQAPPTGAYKSLDNLIERLDLKNPIERDTVTQVQVLRALCKINGTEIRLQRHEKTGEHALAACLPLAPAAHDTDSVFSQVRTAVQLPEVVPTGKSHESLYAMAGRALAKHESDDPSGEESNVMPSTAEDRSHDSTQPIPSAGDTTSESSKTQPVSPPQQVTSQQAAPQDSAPDVENQPETLIVPPLAWKQRVQRADKEPAGVPPRETTQKPPYEPVQNAAREPDQEPADQSGAAKPEHTQNSDVEDQSETLIVPPLDWRERIQRAGLASGVKPEDVGSTPAEDEQTASPPAHDADSPPQTGTEDSDAPANR